MRPSSLSSSTCISQQGLPLSDFAEIGGDGCPAGYFHIPRALFVPSLLSRAGIQLFSEEKKKKGYNGAAWVSCPQNICGAPANKTKPAHQNTAQHSTATGVIMKANGVRPGRGRTRGC
uniref:Uncharacterized protein n=1 Tax=Bionectria ochroleuca TaxID=29856 RepID=A0A8H7K216_BIOOC